MDCLPGDRWVEYQYIDRLIAEAQLQPCGETQGFSLDVSGHRRQFNQQIDIASPCDIVCSRTEQLDRCLAAEYLLDSGDDDLLCLLRKSHGLLMLIVLFDRADGIKSELRQGVRR